MSIQIAEISQRLQSALDQSYNVADMDTVLQVISTLENIQITKEQLETTRLGKYINHLRRKTANESLARRAKNLLKKWREMVLPSANAANVVTQPPTGREFPAGVQYDGRSMYQQPPPAPLLQQQQQQLQQQSYYNQTREPAQFHDVSSTSWDYTKHPSSDSRRYGRSHDTSSNHASLSATEPMMPEESSKRHSKFHENKSNLSANIGRLSSASSSFSGNKSKEIDPYRTLPTVNDNTKSHISISALPKIPKIKNSASAQRLSKHNDRSHSPLVVNSKELPSPKQSLVGQDDNSMHAYDIQNYNKRFPPNQSSILNGRNQDYGEYNLNAMDNNSNSSSMNMNVPNVSQPINENINNEVVKKKHKKHKKDKKNKKQKHSSPLPPTIDRFPSVAGPSILELPDSLSSNSMSLFANTSDSIKDQQPQQQQQQQHLLANSNAYSNSMGISLPSTSANTMATVAAGAFWTPTLQQNSVHTNDLTFTGKFTKADDNIINIDSSSGSNSPKYRTQSPISIAITSRSSSPSRLNLLPMRSAEYGSRVATDEENSSTQQHISLLQQQTESSLTNPFGERSMQNDLITNDSTKEMHSQSIVDAAAAGGVSVLDVQQQTGKKRGRKKGSKGVDSRIGGAGNSSQSQQAGAPYYESISFSSLKNKIDLIRGTTKKVKTTKELLAELQNRKAATSGDEVSIIESQLPESDDGGVPNGKRNSGSRVTTITSPVLTTVSSRPERSSKKSKSAPKEGLISDNQNVGDEDQVIVAIPEPKSMIDLEISELCAKLPPIDKTAFSTWKKSQFDDVVCTCKLIEVSADDIQSSLENVSVPKMLTDCNVPSELASFDGQSHHHQPLYDSKSCVSAPTINSTTTTANTTFITPNNNNFKSKHLQSAREDKTTDSMKPPAKKPAVKSIFDLDDDDDDPITFKINHNNNINLNTKENMLSSSSSSRNNSNNDISDDKSCDELLFLNENIKKSEDGQNERGGELRQGVDESENVDAAAAATATITAKPSVPFNDRKLANEMGKSNAIAAVNDNNENDNVNIVVDVDDDDDVDNDDNIIDGDKNVDGISRPIVIAADSANLNSINSLHDEPKALSATVDLNTLALQSRFRIEEDPDCKAKQLYITSKQSITEYHIEKLHTSYIPNINGNWNEVKCDEESKNISATDTSDAIVGGENNEESTIQQTPLNEQNADDETPIVEDETLQQFENESRITEATIGLYERVVPLCNHLNMDRLPKNLSHINLDFGSSDEVEPHVFIASIRVKPVLSETTTEQTSSPTPCTLPNECRIAIENITEQSDANIGSPDLIDAVDLETRITEDFPIYHCDNDINNIEYGRKNSPELGFGVNSHPECEAIQSDFECEPVEQLEMEVDDIVIHDNNDNDLKSSDNDLCPIANDPFTSIEPKHFDKESDINPFSGMLKPLPLIDENARTDAEDIEPMHQVIDLNPTQLLPAVDENAVDSMDFENQLGKSFDMVNEVVLDIAKHIQSRPGSHSNEIIDKDLNEPEPIPIMEMSDSDIAEDEVNEENDGSSLEEDLSFENYEQDDTSNDHFITLENFEKALVPSSSKHSPSNNSGSSCDGDANKQTGLFGSMVCDDDENEMSDSDDIDDDSDNINNLVVPTMFCKPVLIEGTKFTNLSNDDSDSHSATNSDDMSETKPLGAESSDSTQLENDLVSDQIKRSESINNTESHEPGIFQKLTKDALETHQALSSFDDVKSKRLRSSSSVSTGSSSSSSSSSSSTLSPRKKMKRRKRRMPCPQHYRCASSSSQSSYHSPISVLSPPSMFTNSIAIESSSKPPPIDGMDVTESMTSKQDFTEISNVQLNINSGSDNGHTQKASAASETAGTHQQQMTITIESPSHDDQMERTKSFMESANTSPVPEFLNDQLIEDSIGLSRNCDNDLLFQQLPLPEQLLQSDEKDGEDDSSNSMNGIQSSELSRSKFNLTGTVANDDHEHKDQIKEEQNRDECGITLLAENNGALPSFNNLNVENVTGISENGYKFKEWYEVVHVKSYNDELLAILPYVVID